MEFEEVTKEAYEIVVPPWPEIGKLFMAGKYVKLTAAEGENIENIRNALTTHMRQPALGIGHYGSS